MNELKGKEIENLKEMEKLLLKSGSNVRSGNFMHYSSTIPVSMLATALQSYMRRRVDQGIKHELQAPWLRFRTHDRFALERKIKERIEELEQKLKSEAQDG